VVSLLVVEYGYSGYLEGALVATGTWGVRGGGMLEWRA
jgi:hypothetical protein